MENFSNTDKLLAVVAIAGVLSLGALYLKHFQTKKVIVINQQQN